MFFCLSVSFLIIFFGPRLSRSLLSTQPTGLIGLFCFPVPETTRLIRNVHRVGGWCLRTRDACVSPLLSAVPWSRVPRERGCTTRAGFLMQGDGTCCPLPDGLDRLKVQTDDSRGNSRPWKQMASVAGSSDFAECQVLSSGLSCVSLSSRSQMLTEERFAAFGSPRWNSRLGECRLTRETRVQFHIRSRVFKIETDGSL